MIGIFDSGIGGLTVVREIFRQLPGYDTIYFGDTARTPYGNKSPEAVRRFALEDADFLLSRGAKMIVVACNTVSAVAIDELRRHVSVPVIEVVTPAVEAAIVSVSRLSPKGAAGSPKRAIPKIGVIGTRATVMSGIYGRKLSERSSGEIRVKSRACPLFVPMAEEGWLNRPETAMVAKRYLTPLKWPKVDVLILGCTHYPFLRSAIRKAVGTEVRLIDPAREAVLALKRVLANDSGLERSLSKRHRHLFYVSDRTGQFSRLASAWLKRPIPLGLVNLDSEKIR
ncbi:glutamate racemase [Candidatus Uhrbacteria bacterium]|nr:glutamate racemase [Candidatus Uhrbacteria bacterium]